MRLAFAGIGAMGRAMIANLLAAGHEIGGFDPEPEALRWLSARGGRACGSLAEACEGAKALLIMVVNGRQAQEVLFGQNGAAGALGRDAVVICGSTMPAQTAVDLGRRSAGQGWHYLDAPVSGGTVGAKAGTLTIMAAGSDAAFSRARPLLEVIGKNIYRLGDVPGPGSNMKMVHQLAAGANLAVAAEVMSFGANQGLDPALLLEVLTNSAGNSWMIADRGPRMIEPPHDAKSAVDIFVKDLGIVQDAARSARFPLPVCAAALQVFLGASCAGFGAEDDSQAIRFYQSLGGRAVAAKKPVK